MDLLHSSLRLSPGRFIFPHLASHTLRRRFFTVRFSLPFPKHQAKYHRELDAAIDAVERACNLCVDVKKLLFDSEGRILEKSDQTPVTIADFGVQALVSLELAKLFPSIPLVAEEDSGFLRTNNLVDTVMGAVTDKASSKDKQLAHADVLEAIDRGGKEAFTFCTKPATYWVLDPIDGTRGFLKGTEALYVVGLALVVDGEIVLGVMGCPNWQPNISNGPDAEVEVYENRTSRLGIMMVAHVGCGTWTKKLQSVSTIPGGWTRCFVDGCGLVQRARFCIPDSQTWESLPLSSVFNATTDTDYIHDREAWDHAVGIICVHEAGGKVSDWEGVQIDLEADQAERRIIFPAGGVLVSNGSLHNQILEMISSRSSAVG